MDVGSQPPSGPLTLPYAFDTSDTWRTILKGAFGLTSAIGVLLLVALVTRKWTAAILLGVCDTMLFFFTRLLVRFQSGSVGTLSADRVTIQPNVLLGLSLPGPVGTYPMNRFSAVRVEFRAGPVQPDVQGGPNEVVWLVGRPGTPDIVLARTQEGAGSGLGRGFGSLLDLPVEEVGAPKVIQL